MRLRLCMCLIVLSVSAPAFAQDAPSRGWVDVNVLGLKSQQDEQTVTFITTLFNETASSAAAYPDIEGTGKALEVGAGFRFFRLFGVGVHFDAVNVKQIAGLAATIPHPLILNRSATGSIVSDTLERQDRSVDIQSTFFVPTPDAWMVRVFAGPTYFSVKEERISIIRFNQVFGSLGSNVVTLTDPDVEEVDGTAWGFNAGADVGFFFSRHVGVGGTVRFNKGTVAFEDPLTGEDIDREAGHISFGGGLRLRF